MSSATHDQSLSIPQSQPHRLKRMPSVQELVGTKSLQSPLTQLRVGVESRKDEAVRLDTLFVVYSDDTSLNPSPYSRDQSLILDLPLLPRSLPRARARLRAHRHYQLSNSTCSEQLPSILSTRYRP